MVKLVDAISSNHPHTKWQFHARTVSQIIGVEIIHKRTFDAARMWRQMEEIATHFARLPRGRVLLR